MKSKKLMLFNIVIFLVIVSIVYVGKNSWSTNHQAVDKTVVADEKVEQETAAKDQVELVKETGITELALLKAAMFKKKSKKDFDRFAREDLHIVEIEEEEQLEEEPEEGEEEDLWEVEDSLEEEPVWNQYNSTPVTNTSSNVDNSNQGWENNNQVDKNDNTNNDNNTDKEQEIDEEKDKEKDKDINKDKNSGGSNPPNEKDPNEGTDDTKGDDDVNEQSKKDE